MRHPEPKAKDLTCNRFFASLKMTSEPQTLTGFSP
jgi:hypothetical protein